MCISGRISKRILRSRPQVYVYVFRKMFVEKCANDVTFVTSRSGYETFPNIYEVLFPAGRA